MSDIKEVKVAMSAEEEKALTRLHTRRRKTRKAALRDEMEGGADAAQEMSVIAPVVQKEQVDYVPQVPSVAPVAAPPAPAPVLTSTSTPAPVQSGGLVKIQTRKRTHSEREAATAMTRKNTFLGGAKIVPTKRHALPTKASKPTLFVGGSAAQATQPSQPSQPTPTQPPVVDPVPQPTVGQSLGQSIQTGGSLPKKKRRFTERRLSISMKHVAGTRKHRKSIKKQIAKMSVEEIRKTLQKKGILRSKANPPEEMLRNMMRDFMMLGKPE